MCRNELRSNKYRYGNHGGTPVFTGTRVPVQAPIWLYRTGETVTEFPENFPSVKKEYALKVLEMASKTITTEKILNDPAISGKAWWEYTDQD